MYLYYYFYFQIKDNFEVVELKNLKIDNLNVVKLPKKNLNKFEKIKEYPLFCFCFNIIKNYNFENDNYN